MSARERGAEGSRNSRRVTERASKQTPNTNHEWRQIEAEADQEKGRGKGGGRGTKVRKSARDLVIVAERTTRPNAQASTGAQEPPTTRASVKSWRNLAQLAARSCKEVAQCNQAQLGAVYTRNSQESRIVNL